MMIGDIKIFYAVDGDNFHLAT